MSESKKNVDKADYLTEDPVISSQKFMCISFLKPSNIDDKNRDKNLTVCGVKIRGCYESYEEAKARADFLQKCDQHHNIYIGEVGKWCPFEDNPDKAKDCEYMNKDLNKLMKTYMNQQAEAKDYHEIRKQEMMSQAVEEATKKKKQNEKKKKEKDTDVSEVSEVSIVSEVPNTSDVSDVLDTSEDKHKKIKDLKSNLELDKKELDKEKTEINESINKLRALEQELSEKMKELPDDEIKKMMGLNRG